jgi:hypothetical protein
MLQSPRPACLDAGSSVSAPENRAAPPDEIALLARLAVQGTFAIRDPSDPERIALFRHNGQMTLGAGHAPFRHAAALVQRNLAQWSSPPGKNTRQHLTLACAGGALLRHVEMAETASTATGTSAKPQARPAKTLPPRVNLGESPLMWLSRRKGRDGRPLLEPMLFVAGERLRSDLTLAGSLPRVTANWSAAVAQGARANGIGAEPGDTMVAARQRVQNALRAVGPEFSGLLVDVCGFLKGLELVERERQWPPRSARPVLVTALGKLATHYGIRKEMPGRSRVWQAEGARPEL